MENGESSSKANVVYDTIVKDTEEDNNNKNEEEDDQIIFQDSVSNKKTSNRETDVNESRSEEEDKDRDEEIPEEVVNKVKAFRLTNQGLPKPPPAGCDSYVVVAIENYNGEKKVDNNQTPLKFKKGQLIVVQKSNSNSNPNPNSNPNSNSEDGNLLGIYSKMKEGWFPKYFVKTVEEGPFKVGLITKRGAKRKNWKLRWFQLNLPKREITYRVYPGDKEELGSINLERVEKIVEIDPKDFGDLEKSISSGLTGKMKKMYLLKIVTKTRDWWLAFKEESDRADWNESITASLTWPRAQ
eukprot:TRINITY_DN1298_c0_g2_i1.p1 TRINITY_DN1298_c0_g2~~TRINITY_DN1298_c0_g2_i1.p1  ORF type:complete len:297 (-),score=101.34 TRINITY_DN1298_c0_g2_i1:76-966(-)